MITTKELPITAIDMEGEVKIHFADGHTVHFRDLASIKAWSQATRQMTEDDLLRAVITDLLINDSSLATLGILATKTVRVSLSTEVV